MINLGSKNPILRFKLGRKIKIFKNQNGGLTITPAIDRESLGGYSRIRRNDGTWVWGKFNKSKTFVPITKEVVLKDGTILNTDGTKSSLAVRKIKEEQKAAAVSAMENALLSVAKNISSTPTGTRRTGRAGTRRTTATATRTKPAAQTYTVPEGIDDIAKTQQMLLDGHFYDENYVNSGANVIDGKWGKYTDAAYKAWLEKTKAAKDPINGIHTTPGLGVTNSLFNTQTTPVSIPYFSNYDYRRGNGIKNLGFNNYNGLVDFVKSNKDDLFTRDLVERFGDVNNWKQADVERALGVSGLYRRGILGDYSDIARSMAEWATNKNKEAAAALSALKQNTPPVNNNTSASTPSYDYSRYRFFSTYNPTNLFPTPTTGTTNTNYFTTYNSGNTLLPINSINRFKLFKKGGPIKKFQWAGKMSYPKWEVPRTVATGYGFQNANDTSINLPNVTVTADYKLIIRNKASKKNSKLANFLHALWEVGAFKGVKDKHGKEATYKSAVDGIEGNMTRTAIANAQKMGYNVDTESGTVSGKKSVRIPKEQVNESLQTNANTERRSGLANMYNMTHTATTGGMSTVPSNISGNKDLFDNFILNNVYPYSYGDVLQKGDEVIPYDGGEIPKGWRLRQTTAKDPASVLIKSFLLKARAAMSGMDPRRAFINELAKIDLSTPEGKKKYLEMVRKAPQGLVRITGDPVNDLYEIRSRLDLANRYASGTNLSEWEENPDFSSPTAKSRGEKTYRIKDPKLRERIYGEMINYFLQNKQKGHWNNEHTAYILPSMGFLGNHSLIADDENGLNLRYGDWWDYKFNTPGGHITYIADRLVPEGTYPKATRYGTGHNYDEMTEMADNLVKEAIKEKLGLNKK